MKRGLYDNAFAEIIHPANPGDELLNDASVVVRLVLGGVTVLLAGDIEEKSEMELLDRFGWPGIEQEREPSRGSGRETSQVIDWQRELLPAGSGSREAP